MTKTQTRIAVGETVYGYCYGMRQYACIIRLQVPRKSVFFSDDAKQYLEERLEISNPDELSVKTLLGLKLDPFVETFVGFTTVIAQHALESGSYPAFDDARIISLEAAPKREGETIVSLVSPAVSHLSTKFLWEAYNLSVLIVSEFAKPGYKRKKLDDLTDVQFDKFVKRTKVLAKGGYSSKFILKEAFNRRIPITHLGSGHYQFGFGRNAKRFFRSATPNDSMIGAQLTINKWTCIQHLKLAGIPVPLSSVVYDAQQAQNVADQTGYPVVVKPADRDRGEGVTVDIQSARDVVRAFEKAKQLSKQILVEKRVPGICHRLLVFKDQVIFAYSRHPVSVIGDGKSTIHELVRISKT